MTKFCDICKLANKCRYCFKYGPQGIYMYLENKQYNMRRMEERKAENYPEYSNLHIDKLQLEALGKK